jgi:hypothetical protein
MKYKILNLLFLLFPVVCQAEISEIDIERLVDKTEKEIFNHVLSYPKDDSKLYETKYWYLMGKYEGYRFIYSNIKKLND